MILQPEKVEGRCRGGSISSLIRYFPPCPGQETRLLLQKDLPVLTDNPDNSNYLHQEIKFLIQIQIPIY